jgi:DNA (cytosine-5)-methyltransferase 1
MLDRALQIELDLYPQLYCDWCDKVLTTIDLFCGAGGLTAGFKLGGFRCIYGNDCNPSAIQTFKFNHPEAFADSREVEAIDPSLVRRMLKVKRGELAVLTGGPPCQGFSTNAPERFLEDRRNAACCESRKRSSRRHK